MPVAWSVLVVVGRDWVYEEEDDDNDEAQRPGYVRP